MSNLKSFLDHPIQAIEEALSIRKQIETLKAKLSKLVGTGTPAAVVPPPTVRRKISPETLAKMRAAQQARWTKIKGASSVSAKAPVVAAKAAPAPRRKASLSPEARAKIAAAVKARWAAKKAAASASAPETSASAAPAITSPETEPAAKTTHQKSHKTTTVYHS